MKKTKIILSLILVLCLTFCVAGCSSNHDRGNLKDSVIDGFNSWLQSFSKHALTKDKDLQGDKENGVDEYTGMINPAVLQVETHPYYDQAELKKYLEPMGTKIMAC